MAVIESIYWARIWHYPTSTVLRLSPTSALAITQEEIEHVAILAITTVGWPSAYAAMTWIEDEIAHRDGSR